MNKQVIFLGAGASAADGAPMQSDLFRSYFNNGYSDDELSSFFKDFFGIERGHNADDINFPTFEEVLGVIELSLLRNESFKGYSSIPGEPKIQTIKEKIIFLIANILKAKLENHKPNHINLVNRLVRDNELNKTSFISLNYDILIDNALTDVHDKYDLDYAVDFTNFRKKEDWHKPRISRAVKLFKLHGSLNWLYCPTCVDLTITPKQKSASTIADQPRECSFCSTNMVPIIIPPTFFKVMSNYYLQHIWHSVESELSAARSIVFCGYSFPDADMHVKYLLKRVEINSKDSPDIFIVNNHAGKTDTTKKEEESRYKRFFKDSGKVNYLNLSFQDFCENGLP